MSNSNRPGWIEVIFGRDVQRQIGRVIRRVRRAVIARKVVQVFKSI